MIYKARLLLLALLLTSVTKTHAVTVSVPATSPWSCDTGYSLVPGQAFTVTAWGTWTSGAWTGGPEGQQGQPPTGSNWVHPGGVPYSLVGKIGSTGSPFFIGPAYSGVASETGNLSLSMHDVPEIFWDNSGALTVEVVPEPLSVLGLMAGLAALGGHAIRRKRK